MHASRFWKGEDPWPERASVLVLGLGERESAAIERLLRGEFGVVVAPDCRAIPDGLGVVHVALIGLSRIDPKRLKGLGQRLRLRGRTDPVRVVVGPASRLAEIAAAAGPDDVFRCIFTPWQDDDLRLTVRAAAQYWSYRRLAFEAEETLGRGVRALPGHETGPRLALSPVDAPFGIIGRSRVLRRSLQLLRKALDSDCPVLVRGETGVGKDLVARAIHEGGRRRSGPFVRENCAALTPHLLASELFGHRRGAFTGAIEDRAGLFEAADGGVLFLDEIGDCPPDVQSRLLRAVESGEIRRVGENRTRTVDVRLVTATHRDLEKDVREGRFRSDLYYRISVFVIEIPPLRERPEDVPLLAQHFLAGLVRRHGKVVPEFTQSALAALSEYSFPGNVRELRNEVERAYTLAKEGEAIGVELLSPRVRGSSPMVHESPGSLRCMVELHEARVIEQALAAHGGNRRRTAAALGISRRTLIEKINRYGLRGKRADSGRATLPPDQGKWTVPE